MSPITTKGDKRAAIVQFSASRCPRVGPSSSEVGAGPVVVCSGSSSGVVDS